MSGSNSNNKSGKNSKNNGSSNSGSGDKNQGQSRSSRRRKNAKKKKVDPRVFWGDPQTLPDADGFKTSIIENPSAVIKSLGRPPLSGQQNASELYFTAVYDRAVNLAAALAAAGDLIEED